MKFEWKGKSCEVDCASCPMSIDGHPPHKPVLGEPPRKVEPKGVLLGDGPSQDDVGLGRPFSGNTGMQFDDELTRAGILRTQLLVLHAVPCRHPKKRDGAQIRKAVRACAPLLKMQLETAPRAPTLILGKTAAYSRTGKQFNLDKGRGFMRQDAQGTFIVTRNPAVTFYAKPYEWGSLTVDIERFARVLKETAVRDDSGLDLNLSPSPTQVEAFMAQVLASKDRFISCDIETAPVGDDQPWTGKQPGQAALRSIAVSDGTTALAAHWPSAPTQLKYAFQQLMAEPEIDKVFHNGLSFDIPVLRRHGVEVLGKVQDTRDLRRALSSTSKLSLAHVASLYLDIAPWKEMEVEAGVVADKTK